MKKVIKGVHRKWGKCVMSGKFSYARFYRDLYGVLTDKWR